MEGDRYQQQQIRVLLKSSKLLELAAADDVSGFVSEVEENGIGVDELGFWYGRRNTMKSDQKMFVSERSPLMIASIYGSIRVLKYIIGSRKIDVNKTSGTDGVAALHCAAAGGSPTAVEVVKLLINAGADVTVTDSNGNKPGDLIARGIKVSVRKGLEILLKGFVMEEVIIPAKREFPVDVALPDINGEVYGSDEFRMYSFKVKPCSRAYTHDWTECPFVHPGENARRRDPMKYNYSCVPCPEFKKGSCVNGDSCEYAHGVFESWLHPAQYKTRLCKDETDCGRKVCFFAHRADELRPLYASTGSAIPSPKSPPLPQVSGSRLRTGSNARDNRMDLESLRTQQKHRQLMIDDLSANLYSKRLGELNSSDASLLSPMKSPNTQHRGSYTLRKPANFGFDSAAVVNSRSGAFSKQRSQSFVNRSATAPFSQWGSPEAKVDWGFNGEDANKFRKSASFVAANVDRHQPDVSWVNTLVNDVSSVGVGLYSSSEIQRYGGGGGGGGGRRLSPWVELMFIEQERLAA